MAPGFIDMLGQSEFNVLVDGRAASKITQGVTTEITGEGSSIAPLNDRMFDDVQQRFARYQLTLDFRTLGELLHAARNAVAAGHQHRHASSAPAACGRTSSATGSARRRPAELEQMKALVAQAMEEGALGLSTSLQYVPDRFASTDELVELAVGGGPHTAASTSRTSGRSRARSSSSLDEVFTIAERAKIPAEVWHLKTAYKANWGRMPEVLQRFDEARARGLDVTANMYPYDRASNGLDACLPLWVREGGVEPMLARLKDPAQRDRIKREMDDPNVKDWENQWYGSGGGAGVMLSTVVDPRLRQVRRQDARARSARDARRRSARRRHGPRDRRSRAAATSSSRS